MNLLLEVQNAATWFMAGVIWFVQIVHYPLMARVGVDGFVGYQRGHVMRTGWIVGPAMLVEAATAVLLVIQANGVPAGQAWFGLGLIGCIWLSTAFLQVPLHRALEKGFDARAHAGLVLSNWIRTGLWTGRAVLVSTWM